MLWTVSGEPQNTETCFTSDVISTSLQYHDGVAVMYIWYHFNVVWTLGLEIGNGTVLLIFEARGRDKMGMWDVWCVLDLLIRGYNDNFGWSELLLHKSYVVNSHQNLLTEAVLMKGPQHVMIYVYGEIRRYQNHQRIIPLFRGQRAVLQTIRGNRNNFEIIFHTYKHILWALFTTVSVRRF